MFNTPDWIFREQLKIIEDQKSKIKNDKDNIVCTICDEIVDNLFKILSNSKYSLKLKEELKFLIEFPNLLFVEKENFNTPEYLESLKDLKRYLKELKQWKYCILANGEIEEDHYYLVEKHFLYDF